MFYLRRKVGCEMTIWILQVLVSLIFFAQKAFILAGKKAGWLVGVVAAVLAIFYFYLLGLYVYTVLELGLVVLMGWGFFKTSENPRVETLIRLTTAVVMIFLAALAFGGLLTIVELMSSIGMLSGTYYLTHKRVRLGWGISVGAHLLAWWVGISKEQQIFADFQLASAIVCLVGAMKRE